MYSESSRKRGIRFVGNLSIMLFTIIVEDVLPKKKNNISLNNRIYTQDVEK